MSQQICGMTFEQYVQFHCEFVALMTGGGDRTDADIIRFLKQHGQEPVFVPVDPDCPDEPEQLDMMYYVGAGLKPWEEVINADAELAGKKAMMLIEFQNRAMHGDASESADVVEIEGINLETYAKVCALLHMGGGDAAALYAENGVRDEAHWNAVNAGYQAAMATDTTGRLVTHYGELFMKYQPQHAAAVNQIVTDSLAREMAETKAKEERDAEVRERVYQMASGGDPVAIAGYVKEMITDAEDEDELDWHIESVADRLVEEKKWDALKIILAARFETLRPGGDRDDWVEEEFEMAYDEDDE